MKKRTAWIMAMALALALSLTGCARGNLNGAETIAVLDGSTNITLGEFNLMLRYQQAQMESYYGAIMGGNMYQQDLAGDGTLYGDTAKETLMEEFKKMYMMEAEAPGYGVALTDGEKEAITEAAGKFLEANTEGAKKAATADQKTVERLLTLLTINEKMYDALTRDVDTEVSDAEAAQKRIDYVYVSTLGTEQDEAGNTMELTDAEKAQKKADLQAVLEEARKSGDLDAAAQTKELTASSATYGADSTYPAEEVRKAADALKEGEFADLVETDTIWSVWQVLWTGMPRTAGRLPLYRSAGRLSLRKSIRSFRRFIPLNRKMT